MGLDIAVLFRCVITVDILLCAAIILTNLVLLSSILLSRAARARTRNAMLVSVCMADLMVGLFTHPLYIHSYRTESLFLSCELHIVMQLIGDYSQDFVCYWTLVTLGASYVHRVTKHRWGWGGELPGTYRPLTDPPATRWRSLTRGIKKVLLVVWPWLGTLLIPIPILMATVEPETKETLWDETFCPLHVAYPFRMAVLVLVFYAPIAVLALICLLIGLVMYCDMAMACSRRQARQRAARNAHSPHAAAVSPGEAEVAGSSDEPPTGRSGWQAGRGGGRPHDQFPASSANRPFRGGGGGRGGEDGRANGYPAVRGNQICRGRSAGEGEPPALPTLAFVRSEEEEEPADAKTSRVWSLADDDGGGDDGDDDPTHVMMSPVGPREDGAQDVNRDVQRESQRNGQADNPPRRMVAAAATRRDAEPAVTLVADDRRRPESARDVPANNGDPRFCRPELPAWREEGGEPLERPGHVLVPLLVVVLCAAPLMVGWWFYDRMEHSFVIILSVTLSRLYLLRAALLPVAWFTLPELRAAACALWRRFCRGRGGPTAAGGGANGELGEFSVAYTTLRETVDAAPSSADDRRDGVVGGRVDVRRQNPFDTDVRA